MKKTKTISMLVALLMSMVFVQSCKDDDEPEPTTNNEFIADDASFAGWDTWDLIDTKNGIDPSLNGAHAGNDSTAVRKIYVKDAQKPVDGAYPIGTLVVKHMKSDSMEMITAMAKCGNNFDAANIHRICSHLLISLNLGLSSGPHSYTVFSPSYCFSPIFFILPFQT